MFIRLYKGTVCDNTVADIYTSQTRRVNKTLLIGSRFTPQNPAKMAQIGCKNSTLRFQFLLTDGSTTHIACDVSPVPETGE